MVGIRSDEGLTSETLALEESLYGGPMTFKGKYHENLLSFQYPKMFV